MISFFNKIFVSKQNSPRFAASHLDPFYLPMSHKKDARLIIWVKYFNQNPACYHACVIIENRTIMGERGGLVVNASDSGSRGRGFEPHSGQPVLCP